VRSNEQSADEAIDFFVSQTEIKSGTRREDNLDTYFVTRIKEEIRKELFGDERPLDEEKVQEWTNLDLDAWVAKIEAVAGINTSEIARSTLNDFVMNG